MNNPLVTVACITYNHGEYLSECLDGILSQRCSFSVEVIIHDDKSTDNTRDIIREYERLNPHLIVILQEDNQYSKGKKPLIDFILPVANGKYIAFCEGDDYWTDPDKLQKQVDFLESHPDYVFCSHIVDRVDSDKNVLKKGELLEGDLYFMNKDIFHFTFPTLSLVFRHIPFSLPKEAFRVHNGDAVLTGLLSGYGKAAHLNFIGAAYRVHSGGVFSSNGFGDNVLKSIKTRKSMLKMTYFSEWQKSEIKRALLKRKWSLAQYAIRKFDARLLMRLMYL